MTDERFTGCDTNYDTVEAAARRLENIATWASFGIVAVDCDHIKSSACNIHVLNQQHRLHGYNPAVDDGILVLVDRIGQIISDRTFERSVHIVYRRQLRTEINAIRKAVAMRIQANRSADGSKVVPLRRTA